MSSREFFLTNMWRRSAGLPEKKLNTEKLPPLKEVRRTRWNKRFEELMRNRLLVGAYRYGDFKDAHKIDYLSEIIRRAKKYQINGNDELLVDIANFCLVEFAHGRHPKKHFKSGDDTGHAQDKK